MPACVEVGAHVGFDLFARKLRPRYVPAARIADPRGEVADDQRNSMAGLGKTLQRMQHDHEAQMQVGTRGIDPELNAQRPPQTQPLLEIRDGFDVLESLEQIARAGRLHVRSSINVTPVEPSSSLPYRRLLTPAWPRRYS